ncbi:MAG: polysaccharide ABC transporter ATP-binding protein, partial [Bacteroidales bacterium]|nr:polysaccharide ABC transporter ATP-binding protein [Bacteroidales bacterium]
DYVWALRDISFKIEQGDVVGIIGKNGAGKSTLLKLLSHITAPSTGHIQYRGRIASLLEVGTGFHPELTGRQNIYMNGSIMGMTRKEIDRKLDEIVDFAGVELYLDTPTKRYSSGMQVRLGFAVAAFLEPEILVVDEVLAVGDAEFQRKAIGKMQDVATCGGRTVLFVSHNMASVRQLCKSGIVLKNGMVEMTGTADECVDFYMETSIDELVGHRVLENGNHHPGFAREVEYREVRILNDHRSMASYEPIELEVLLHRNIPNIKEVVLGIFFDNSGNQRISATYTNPIALPAGQDDFKVRITIPNHQLAKGCYNVKFNILDSWDFQGKPREYDSCERLLSFEVKYVDALHKTDFVFWPHQHMGSFALAGTKGELVK